MSKVLRTILGIRNKKYVNVLVQLLGMKLLHLMIKFLKLWKDQDMTFNKPENIFKIIYEIKLQLLIIYLSKRNLRWENQALTILVTKILIKNLQHQEQVVSKLILCQKFVTILLISLLQFKIIIKRLYKFNSLFFQLKDLKNLQKLPKNSETAFHR